jgi:membrane-associated phospholipid phosphatase
MHESTFADARPARRRWSYLLPGGVGAAATVAFVLLAAAAAADGRAGWDAHLSHSLYAQKHNPNFLGGHGDMLVWVLGRTSEVLALVALAVILVVLARRRRFRDAALLLAAVAGTFVLEPALKDLIKRPPFRPDDSGYSFPSGHAMRSAAALAAVAITAWPSRWRWLVAVASVVLCALIGVALVYDGWHWGADVVGGWCAALAWVSLVYLGLRAPLPNDKR